VLIIAVLGPSIAPYDPLATHAAQQLLPPSLSHPCGTDHVGRDICSRIIVATRVDLTIGLGAAVLALVAGRPHRRRRRLFRRLGRTGSACGWWTRSWRFHCSCWRWGIVAALGNSFVNIIYATAIVNVPFYARTVRTEMSQRRGAGFVEAAQVAGNTPRLRILLVHLFPCAIPALVVQMSLTMGWAILNAASLSFIGLGITPPAPEWGLMVAEGASFIISGEWWVSFMPG